MSRMAVSLEHCFGYLLLQLPDVKHNNGNLLRKTTSLHTHASYNYDPKLLKILMRLDMISVYVFSGEGMPTGGHKSEEFDFLKIC